MLGYEFRLRHTHWLRNLRKDAAFSFSELCWGKAMVASIQSLNKGKKEEIERLRGERDQIKLIDLGFERWQVVSCRKARGRQDVP